MSRSGDSPPPRFPLALRGYDCDAVDAFLDDHSSEIGPQAKRQLDRFGERVEVILTAAEDTATDVTTEASVAAAATGAAAEEEARRMLVAANAKAEEILVEADRKGQRLVSDGVQRRREIEAEIAELASLRDELADGLRTIARQVQLTAEQNSRVEAINPEDELEAAEELEAAQGLSGDEDDEARGDELQAELGEPDPAAPARGPRFRIKDSAAAKDA